MKSTQARPTAPGFYWYKDNLEDGWVILEVSKYNGVLFASNESITFRLAPETATPDEWWGESKIEELVDLPPTQYYPQLGEHHRS